MKSNYVLKEAFRATVDNGRGHELLIDLPEGMGGTNQGPKAFEVLTMSLCGCVGTIFKILAGKMKLEVSDVRVEMETEEGETIEKVSYKLFVKSKEKKEKLERCLEMTEKNCPVGRLFHKAGVPFEHELVVL